MNIIKINNKIVSVLGNIIKTKYNTQHGNHIVVNGVVVADNLSGNVHITFEGDLASLDCTSATIHGNVNGNIDCTSITVNGNITGDVDGTNVICKDITGDVDAVSVKCNSKKKN